jgi:hypothetical protein
MLTTFDPRTASLLAERAYSIQVSAAELAGLGEHDPGLAGDAGVEICALEARVLLASGAPERVRGAAQEAARVGRPAQISASDLEALSRLEAVVAMGSSRIGLRLASMDAEAAQVPAVSMGNMVGLATGAIGFIRSFF